MNPICKICNDSGVVGGVSNSVHHQVRCDDCGGFYNPVIKIPITLHPDTAKLVIRFASALAAKLRKAEIKYGFENHWQEVDWMDECRAKLREHLEKGDPLDVANFCAFLWHHNESTTSSQPDQNHRSKSPREVEMEEALKYFKAWGEELNRLLGYKATPESWAMIDRLLSNREQP